VGPTTGISSSRVGETASVFAAMGDETRLRILGRLSREGPLAIARLTEGTHLSRQAVTKHLLTLSRAGLVRGRRRGRERLWQLQARRLNHANYYLQSISEQWDEALSRLKTLVEQDPPRYPA